MFFVHTSENVSIPITNNLHYDKPGWPTISPSPYNNYNTKTYANTQINLYSLSGLICIHPKLRHVLYRTLKHPAVLWSQQLHPVTLPCSIDIKVQWYFLESKTVLHEYAVLTCNTDKYPLASTSMANTTLVTWYCTCYSRIRIWTGCYIGC